VAEIDECTPIKIPEALRFNEMPLAEIVEIKAIPWSTSPALSWTSPLA